MVKKDQKMVVGMEKKEKKELVMCVEKWTRLDYAAQAVEVGFLEKKPGTPGVNNCTENLKLSIIDMRSLETAC